MLQSMRHLAHSWYFKGLMLILVVSFGIWNIGDIFRGNPLHQVVATAGSASFTVQDLNRAFEQDLARARQMFKPDLTAQQAKQMGVADNALNDLIENSLFDQDLKRLGIEADDRTVIALLMRDPKFKDKDGNFDKSLLQNFIAQQRAGERAFLNQQRTDLASRQLVGSFTDLPPVPQGLIDALYRAHAQKRILDVVTLDDQNFSPSSAPDDKTLMDVYEKNSKPFTTPELRGLTVATLSTENVAKDITISDDQVKKEYDAKGDQLVEPEKRDLLQVILQDEDKAKELAKAAQASGNLVTAAKPTGHEVMPLNQTDESGLPADLAKPVFALPKGGVSDPVKTPLGWHVIQVRSITPTAIPPYDTIKEKLRTTMKNDQAGDTISRMVNELDDGLAAGHPLEDMVAQMKMQTLHIKAITADGKTADGKDVADLPYKDDVVKSAFAQNSGESSPVMDDKKGNYFVVRTDDITPSAIRPFDQVKAEVLALWERQERAKNAKAAAADIAKAFKEGKDAASFVAQKGVTVSKSKAISEVGDADPLFTPAMLPQIFRLQKGETTILPAQNGKQMVVRVAQIIPAETTKDDATTGKIISEYNGNMPKELADEYIKYLRIIFPVHIHADALDSIAQGN